MKTTNDYLTQDDNENNVDGNEIFFDDQNL